MPGIVETPPGGYKDNGEPGGGAPPRVKRQAARFRIYRYDSSGAVIRELTADDAEIGISLFPFSHSSPAVGREI